MRSHVEPPVGDLVAGWSAIADDPAFHRLLRPGAALVRLATGAIWAEGPVWLPGDGSVLWSDIPNDRVLRWHPDGRTETFLDPAEYQNGHTLDLDGSVLACSHGRRRIERVALDGTLTPIVERYGDARLNSPNDLVVRSDGTIWFTDPPFGIISDREGHQAESEIGDSLVFRFDPATSQLDVATDWVDAPNGLAFSPDESILYVADTASALPDDTSGNHHIVAFDVVGGRRLADPRVFYVVEGGFPDGFRVDVDGNVWTSAHDGIHVLAPSGRRLGRIPIPEPTSNCVFGGPDGDRLFITASTSLYAIDVAIGGAVRPTPPSVS
jgi:gluconolactonase